MIDEWGKGAKYWDHAWNPMIGCKKISEGCANCYAARLAAQYPELRDASGGFEPHPPKDLKNPPKSGVVFVGNMTDLFGEWNDEEQITKWIGRLSMDATNLLLTKRPKNMYWWWRNLDDLVIGNDCWYGITAETQDKLESRCSHEFMSIQENRWLSIEPLLERVDLCVTSPDNYTDIISWFQWVVVGAESGPKRRPCSLDWVRQIVEQCREAQVPVFVKQLDINGKLVKDIREFPEDLQIRQVPWKNQANKE